jgi:hypothetical protein
MSGVYQHCIPCGKSTPHKFAEELKICCRTCNKESKVLQRRPGTDKVELIDDTHLQDMEVFIQVPTKLTNYIRRYKHGNI